MKPPTLMLAIILVFLVFLPTLSQENDDAAAPATCSKWSVKGVRLGMALEEVKSAHKKLKHGRNWLRRDDRGKDWYFWAESRMRGIYNYVLPETDAPHAEIISLVVLLDVSDSSPDAVIGALEERWGQPIAREVPIGTVRYYSVFGAPRGEFDWKATTWEDQRCDVLVTLLDKIKMSPVGYVPPFKEVTLSMDSLEKLIEKKERELEKARDIVRP